MTKKKKHHLTKQRSDKQNFLYTKQQDFLKTMSEQERTELFNPAIDSERRAELWMEQAEIGEGMFSSYYNAIP
jgi:hypothetical protein